MVIIAPQWDGNISHKCSDYHGGLSHHRTTVGWKHFNEIAPKFGHLVIIAPQWDGNSEVILIDLLDFDVIIAPQWDGNTDDENVELIKSTSSSHHSGMETLLGRLCHSSAMLSSSHHSGMETITLPPFNNGGLRHHRTTVGWKLSCRQQQLLSCSASSSHHSGMETAPTPMLPFELSSHHRTTVGWKLDQIEAINRALAESSSHHSGMETPSIAALIAPYQVIIAPQWDGNCGVSTQKNGWRQVIIAPQWDGNRLPRGTPPVGAGVIIAPQWDGNARSALTGR